MPFFRYVARDSSGKLKDEVVEAASQEDLVNSLQAKGFYVVSIGPAVQEVKHTRRAKIRYHRGARTIDLIMFSRELATLMSSGITLIKSLDILCKQIESQMLLSAVQEIKKDIESGYTFHEALKKHTVVFSGYWLHLVETGEASGHLPLSLERLADYLETSSALRKKIVSAMIYPVLLMCVALVAVLVFLIKIIPIFSDIFKGFNAELPLLTRMVISASDIIGKYYLIAFGGGGMLFFALKKYVSTERGRWQFDSLKFKLPLVGPVIQEISTERFTSGLSTLLESGVPILHALEITEKTAGNMVMQKELREVREAVRHGKGIAQTMQEIGLFSPLVVQMIGVGEEIGELGKMLNKISLFYKERVDTFISRFTAMFEPLVLVFVGIIVGVMVVAMFMPIFGISSAIKASG